jgi:type II secretory pathway component PulF
LRAFFASTDPAHITCSTSSLARFTKQLAVLFGSGVALHESLESLTRVQSDNLSIFVLPELRTMVMNGHRFSSALAKYPKVFPRTYVALIRGAEETGELQLVMEQLSVWLEKQDKLQRHVKKALTYPAFVILLASVLTLILFKTVIPQILETVVSLGAELPLPTKILKGIVWWVGQPMFWLLIAMVVAGTVWYFRTPKGYRQLLLLSHYTPVMGGILSTAGAARFSGTLSMLLRSGVDVLRACKIAADASGHPLLVEDSKRVLEGLRQGQYLSEVLGARPYYPLILSDMIKVGDESGEMSKIIKQCSQMLEEDTVHRIDMFMNLLEPIVLAAVSFIVGSVLIAVLMPMSNLISAL